MAVVKILRALEEGDISIIAENLLLVAVICLATLYHQLSSRGVLDSTIHQQNATARLAMALVIGRQGFVYSGLVCVSSRIAGPAYYLL